MLCCGHLNVRSLLNNFDIFKDQLNGLKLDILGVSETWLHRGVSDRAVAIENYSFIRCDRNTRVGGGVGIYISNEFEYTVIVCEVKDFIEHIWIRVKFDDKCLIVGNLYRPPNGSYHDFINHFEDKLINIFAQYDLILCFGDFNVNMLNIGTPHAIQLNNVLETFGLVQLISEPTRISRTASSLIDLVCYNSDDVIEEGVRDVHISDHMLVYCKLALRNNHCSETACSYRALRRININNFQIDLENIPWHLIYETDDIESMVSFLATEILTLFNVHAPLKVVRHRVSAHCPWITDNVRLMKKLRNEALKRFRCTKDPNHWNYYKQLRNLTTSAIRSEKKAYLDYKFRNCNAKEKWTELKKLNLVNKKNKNIPTNLKNPNELNLFFTQIINRDVKPKQEIIDFYLNHPTQFGVFRFEQVTEEHVSNVILGLRSRAFGPDNINLSMIVLCCPFIIQYITYIINQCILKSYFPAKWQFANVIPIPKVKAPLEFGHLRSISILPVLSKVLEKIMEIQVRKYLTVHDIVPLKQSGFRPNFSCSTALSDIVDDIVSAHDINRATILVLLDYSKAFDMLNHQILGSILTSLGFHVSASSLVSSFLSHRTQRVVIDGEFSDILEVKSGVPQGSILGPLLYTIFTSNFIRYIKYSQYHLYADDTQIYISFNRDEVQLANFRINEDLENILRVSEDHLLQINPNKTVAMLFCSENSRDTLLEEIHLKLGGKPIAFESCTRNLGLFLDHKLKFGEHITSCLRKGFSALKLIYSQRHCLNLHTRMELCNSLVLSHFDYADSVYGPFLDTIGSRRIQKLQNACIRLICGIRRGGHVSHRLKDLGWLNMYNRRLLHSLCFYYKIIKYRCPPYLYNKLTFRTDVHNVNIRRKNLLTIPLHNKEMYKKSYSYLIACLINKFGVRDFSLSAPAFKRRMKSIVFSQQCN